MVKILAGLIFLLTFQFPVFAAAAPTLESPPSGSTTSDTSPTLSWSWNGTCSTSGSCYRVQVDDQADFSSPKKDYYTSNTSYSPQLENGSWYWRVKAKDASGWSDWSQVWNFVIGGSGSSTPTPASTQNPTSSQTSTGNLTISLSEIYPAPAYGEKEWVEIFNPNSQNIDLTNWKFVDAAGNKRSLAGTIAANSFAFFEYSSGWLNNSGDTVNLLDANSATIESYSYSEIGKDLAWAKDNGSWWQTSTPTKGLANQITSPASGSEASSKSSKSKNTKDSTPVPTTTSQILGKRSQSSGIVSGIKFNENFASPSFNLATISAEESSPAAEVEAAEKSNLGLILIILGSIGVLLSGGLIFIKHKLPKLQKKLGK